MHAVVPALAIGLLAAPLRAQDSPASRFVGASSLNLRAAPAANAEVLLRWRLNQPVTLLAENGRWCHVVAADGGPSGHVDCSFLARSAVTRQQIEAEAAEAALALLRLSPPQGDGLRTWTMGIERQVPEVRRLLDQLMQQAERHLALSPTLYTYRDISAVLRQLREVLAQRDRPELAPLRAWVQARIAAVPALRPAFSTDFATDPREPLQASVLGELGAALQHRQARVRSRLGDRPASAPLAPSYFMQGRWAVGWAGGPLAQAGQAVPGQGSPYTVSFDGNDVASLAGVFEMAKQQRAAVQASFGALQGELQIGLTRASTGADGEVETLRLQTNLAAWAVTEQGLLPARIVKASYAGGACAGESDEGTRIGVLLPQPSPGALLAVFASSAPVDPARARVSVQRRRFLAPLWDLFENTLTERQTVTVDLDGDGVPDLRVLISSDTAVSQAPLRQRVGFQTVAGWYANDVHQLEANVDGRWRVLSSYAVVTCT